MSLVTLLTMIIGQSQIVIDTHDFIWGVDTTQLHQQLVIGNEFSNLKFITSPRGTLKFDKAGKFLVFYPSKEKLPDQIYRCDRCGVITGYRKGNEYFGYLLLHCQDRFEIRNLMRLYDETGPGQNRIITD